MCFFNTCRKNDHIVFEQYNDDDETYWIKSPDGNRVQVAFNKDTPSDPDEYHSGLDSRAKVETNENQFPHEAHHSKYPFRAIKGVDYSKYGWVFVRNHWIPKDKTERIKYLQDTSFTGFISGISNNIAAAVKHIFS